MTRRYSSQRGRKVSTGTYGSDENVFTPQATLQPNLSALHSSTHVLSLQRMIGNRATRGLLGSRLGVPVVQRVRDTMPEGLSENYNDWVQGFTMESIDKIDSEALDKDEQIWNLLKQNFGTMKSNGVRYFSLLTDAINTFKGLKGEDSNEKETNKQDFIKDNQDKRSKNKELYDTHYKSKYKEGGVAKTHLKDESIQDTENTSAGYENYIETNKQGDFYIKADDNMGRFGEGDKDKRIPNSEIFWLQMEGYLKEVEGLGDVEVLEKQTSLPYLKRTSISNKETLAVIFMCIDDVNKLDQRHSFEAGSDEFKALLGTENGRAAVFLAKDHLDQMGKTISHIEACIKENGGWLQFHYKPIE